MKQFKENEKLKELYESKDIYGKKIMFLLDDEGKKLFEEYCQLVEICIETAFCEGYFHNSDDIDFCG